MLGGIWLAVNCAAQAAIYSSTRHRDNGEALLAFNGRAVGTCYERLHAINIIKKYYSWRRYDDECPAVIRKNNAI